MPRVAIIAQKWLPAYGGANRFTHDLATTLIERGRNLARRQVVEGDALGTFIRSQV